MTTRWTLTLAGLKKLKNEPILLWYEQSCNFLKHVNVNIQNDDLNLLWGGFSCTAILIPAIIFSICF